MKFDVLIMNPPYDKTLHEKFFLKSFDICSGNIVTIEPASWLLGNRRNKELCNKVNSYKSEIELVNGSLFNDAEIQCQVTINHIDKTSSETGITINNKVYQSTNDIYTFVTNDSLTNLYLNIKQDIEKDNVDNHLKRSWKDESPNKESFIVRVPAIRGHIDKKDESGKLDDFYTVISNDPSELDKTIGIAEELYYNKNIVKLYFEFNTEFQANAFLKYIVTYFFRACLALRKRNLHLDSGEYKFIPWLDFNNPIFNKSVSEIDDWLFSKYNISEQDISNFKSILKNYYNI